MPPIRYLTPPASSRSPSSGSVPRICRTDLDHPLSLRTPHALEAAYPSTMRTLRSHGQPTVSAQTSIARRLIRKRPLAARPSEEPRQSSRGPLPRNEPDTWLPTEPNTELRSDPPDKEPEALCPICLCELSGSDYGTTQCGHSFHTECLSIWMIHDRRHTCPECRAHVGASASRSRMFAATGESHNLPVLRAARMPRFHGG